MDGITTSINTILKNLIKDFNTFLDSPVRFSGEYDGQKVQHFIEYIEYYKRVKCIGDDQALQELEYLLLGQAHSWWLRRKSKINSWSEALTLLENQYSKRRSAHVVFTEILKHNFSNYESTDDFIDDKMELFNELAQQELKADNKFEKLYALLPVEIQHKVKLVNIRSVKELKEELKIIKLNNVEMSQSRNQINISSNNIPGGSDVQNVAESHSQEPNCITEVNSNETYMEPERDPIIKVRRAEDLMPANKEEEGKETTTQQNEFLHNRTAAPTNDSIQSNRDAFQIDNDIMNQINNIIDESEMNLNAGNNTDNRSEPSNAVSSLQFLEFGKEATTQLEVVASNVPTDNTNKSNINTTKKGKTRCSYCRGRNHTSQACFKRARLMKEFPEKFIITQSKLGHLPSIRSENTIEALPLSTTYISTSTTNTSTINCNNTPAEPTTTTPFLLHQVPANSISYNPLIANTPCVTTSTGILNNISDKCINSSLATKLIAPINGKTPNKVLAAKLRSINKPSLKCHQCGTVGFYKSICPNCSPIYNNNNHHIQHL